MQKFFHGSACVEDGAVVGENTFVWHNSVIRENAVVGKGCNIGQNCYVAPFAFLGNGVKLQNNVSVFSGVRLEDNVFCGPSVVFTNVLRPRCEFPKDKECYEKTLVKKGASIGAGAVIVAGATIGEYAMVGAGSVVTGTVPNHALVVGSPARLKGLVCCCGESISAMNPVCGCGRRYSFSQNGVTLLEETAQ